jgi:phosphoserine phosphatase
MTDLVIQGRALGPEARDTFKVVAMPERIRSTGRVARCSAVRDDAETRRAAAGLATYWKVDTAFVDPAARLADFRLLALDMDSTLINIESLDDVAALAGKGEAVAAITEAAMRGEITDYADSLRRRVAMLAGVDAELLERVLHERLRLNEGAERLVRTAQQAGLATLLVSGGFTFFTERMRERLGFTATCSNALEIVHGRLTGGVTGAGGGPIIDAAGKAQAVREVCAELGCGSERAIVVGDGANDLAMMAIAGVSVAYRAKPAVRARATHALDHAPLDGILNWFADTAAV